MPPSLWTDPAPLVLASTSATRRDLLVSAGLPVEVVVPGIDEHALAASLGPVSPRDLAASLARAKALAVSARRPGRLVLGADQVGEIDGMPFGKPGSSEDAVRRILDLAGRRHRLHAAVALARDGAVLRSLDATADLVMRPLDARAVRLYVALAGDAATRSAGGYEIEGLGRHLFESVEGDLTTVLGLPMLPLLAALRSLGRLRV